MSKQRNAKLRCSKCYKKYYPVSAPRLWNQVVVIRAHGEYTMCKCQHCDYIYISQSVAARRLLESQNNNNN